MRIAPSRIHSPRERALSLIELIGVLAVLAIVAAALVPAFIRQMDKLAGDKESESLKAVGDALQQSILRTRSIPGTNDWAVVIAQELGVNLSSVTNNARSRQRVFLIDPNFQVGTNGNGLPYKQTNYVLGSVLKSGGLLIPPTSPRVLLLSSIGRPLPAGLPSGVPSSTDFNAVWDWNDSGTALPASSTWTGWAGQNQDLRVQRINLSSLFVRLVLNTYSSPGLGRYSIDWASTNSVPTNSIEGYFLQNSVLGLHNHDGTLDSQQILIRDTSFVYNEGVWRGSISGFSPLAGILDVGSVVDKFLGAPLNQNADGGANQLSVIGAMQAYMQAYQAWAAAGFPHGNVATYDNAKAAQNTMVSTVFNLMNSPTEQICP